MVIIINYVFFLVIFNFSCKQQDKIIVWLTRIKLRVTFKLIVFRRLMSFIKNRKSIMNGVEEKYVARFKKMKVILEHLHVSLSG